MVIIKLNIFVKKVDLLHFLFNASYENASNSASDQSASTFYNGAADLFLPENSNIVGIEHGISLTKNSV